MGFSRVGGSRLLLHCAIQPSCTGYRIVKNSASATSDIHFCTIGSKLNRILGKFDILYTKCTADLEWKLIYVGSAEDETYDQLLESVLVGPVNVGNYRFVLQADPPDPSKIREEDIIGVTVLLLTCSYMGQEFVRVGYYVNNDYDDEQLREEPPQKILIDRIQRNILSDKPRVTKFPINFHPENSETGEQATPPNHAGEADGCEEQSQPSPNHLSDEQHKT
ncbi:UNVERIFIED_CONTAM: putative histone chaperone ASF1A [Sesamum calycinum]|uniref:Histone chaperone ASF1A n=1 Tax=Sesamum calycinum TaxID=2727403 RepID=A0AAW2MN06_9LAMI